MKDFRRHPPHVPTTSTSPQTLPDCHSSPAVARLAASRISDPRFSARSRPPTVSTPRTPLLFGTLCTSLKLHPVVSVANKAYSVCVTQRSIGHCRFLCSCWKVRHCLRLCVLQKRHVLLIHQGEVFLELETELEPGLCVVVVLDKFRSKLQDFCDVRRRHITAPLPCASFACSVTRSTTNGVQQDDFMMWTPVQMI